VKNLTLSIILFASVTSAFAGETLCQDIPLEKITTEGNSSEVREISLRLKRTDDIIKVGDELVTDVSPLDPDRGALAGRSAIVTKMKLIEQVKVSERVQKSYGVKITFPYNKEIAQKYNSGMDDFYTICRVYED
jgi:hypothetical protein